MKKLIWLSVFTTALLGACGGKVVFESANIGGAGGQGGQGGSGQGTAGGGVGAAGPGSGGNGGASCQNPPGTSSLEFCGGSAVAGGGTTMCDTFYCDNQGNQLTTECTDTMCVCSFNDVEFCSCQLDEPVGSFCEGLPTCCGF